jgi:hypothetical protein
MNRGRSDERRKKLADMDVRIIAELRAERFQKTAQAELAGAVRGRKGEGYPGSDGVGIDQDAPLALDEVRQRRARTMNRAEQVGRDHLRMHLHRSLVQEPNRAHPRIIDPDVDPAESTDCLARQVLDLFRNGDIGADDRRFGADSLALARDLAENREIARRQHESRAGACKFNRARAAVAAGGAGDHDDGMTGKAFSSHDRQRCAKHATPPRGEKFHPHRKLEFGRVRVHDRQMKIRILALGMVAFSVSLASAPAFALCGITYTVEPLKETLPPESEIVHAPNQGAQLRYKGSMPIVFFSKSAIPLDASGSVQLVAMGLPTRRGETPVAKIEGDRQFRFARGQLDENGRLQIKGWELESTPSAYALSAPTAPDLKPEIVQQILSGKIPSREEIAPIPYYYGREPRKIDVKYTFKRVPGYDPAQCR